MKIVSYNTNGIRAAIKKGFVDWVASNDFDIICIQETKASVEQVDMTALEDLGYEHYWHSAQKKGYSGVLTLTKKTPTLIKEGFGIEKYDMEGRMIRTDFGDWTLLNCLKKERPKLILVGDYNIAHEAIDIHNPKSKNSGFLPDERAWMTKWFENGFTDAYRFLNPEKIEYSWWSYRANARANNKGWRIDYQSVTDNLKDYLKEAYHMSDAKHSDHCPVYLEIDLK